MSTEEPALPSAEALADMSYTQATNELDAIVSFFEQREVDVDQLVAKLERATAIVDELDRRIRRTRTQVEELVPRLEAAVRKSDADNGDDSDEEFDAGSVPHDKGEEVLQAWDDDDDDEGEGEPALF